jgi:hypothetical protein
MPITRSFALLAVFNRCPPRFVRWIESRPLPALWNATLPCAMRIWRAAALAASGESQYHRIVAEPPARAVSGMENP